MSMMRRMVDFDRYQNELIDDLRLRMFHGHSWRDYAESVRLIDQLRGMNFLGGMLISPDDEGLAVLAYCLITYCVEDPDEVVAAISREPPAHWWLAHYSNDSMRPAETRKFARRRLELYGEHVYDLLDEGELRPAYERRARTSWTTRLFNKEDYQNNLLNDLALRIYYGCQPDRFTDRPRQYAESMALVHALRKTGFEPVALIPSQMPPHLLAYCLVAGTPYEPAEAVAAIAEGGCGAWLQYFSEDEAMPAPLRETAQKRLRRRELEERATARKAQPEAQVEEAPAADPLATARSPGPAEVPAWYSAASEEKHTRQVVVTLPPDSVVSPRVSNLMADPGFMQANWAAALLLLGDEGPFVFAKATGIFEALRGRPATVAFAFYRLQRGGVFQLFVEMDSPEIRAGTGGSAYIVEHSRWLDEEGDRKLVDALIERDDLEICFVAPGDKGPCTGQFGLRVGLAPEAKAAMAAEWSDLLAYHQAIASRDYAGSLDQYNQENPMDASPILLPL